MLGTHLSIARGGAAHGGAAWRVPPTPARIAASPMLMSTTSQEEERKERLKQLFGDDFKDAEERELSRVQKVQQPEAPEEAPEWMVDPRRPVDESALAFEERAKRFQLWLEAGGVNLDKILLVRASADDERPVIVAAEDVRAGSMLFEIPAELLLTADSAFADPSVGKALKDVAAKQRQPGKGFDTFAIATLLATERVRRAAVKSELKRQDPGVLGGGAVLPKWESKTRGTYQSNNAFSPFIEFLPWPDDEECLVDSAERAEAVRQGASLIARLIEPTARNAWMKATQRRGLAQATSDEDCECTATQALILAMGTQMDAPPPLGRSAGEAAWGGTALTDASGPALCPLVHLVLPSAEISDAARAAGTLDALVNAQLGRPETGSVDSAIRCVASKDLKAGDLILADAPGAPPTAAMQAAAAEEALKPGDRVTCVGGAYDGRLGSVLTLRPADRKIIVRLDGEDKKLAVLPRTALSKGDGAKPKRKGIA